MKFIHTGDIHWGMCPDANKPWGKERAQAIKDTFRIIIEKAKEMELCPVKLYLESQRDLHYG